MSARQRIVPVFLMVSLLLISIMAGCGTLSMKFHTTIKTSGDIVQQIRFEGSGMMATVIDEDVLEAGFERDGWEVDVERTDELVTLVATKSLSRDETILIPQPESGEFSVLGSVFLRSEDGLLTKEYFIAIDVAGSGEELEVTNGEFEELAEMMLEGMLDISWTITLPGKIVESNADTVEGGSATWEFDTSSLASGRYLMVHSQYTNWPVIGGIIAGVVVVLALVVFLIIRKRRTPTPFSGETAD
jgi:hypothetical protein